MKIYVKTLQPVEFESGQERPGMFSGLREGIGNFFGGLDIGPSGVENERRVGKEEH